MGTALRYQGNLAAVFQDHCWEGEVQPPSDGFRDVPEPGPQGAQGEGQKLSGLGSFTAEGGVAH